MSFALIEVEALAKKAARGAGYSWGMAEEAGKAASWLCAQGVDGVAALAQALASDTPGAGCLDAGTHISDTAMAWKNTGCRLEAMSTPVLLLPFAAYAARQVGQAVHISWPGVRCTTDGQALCVEGGDSDALFAAASLVTLTFGDALRAATLSPQTRAKPAAKAWQALADWAQRTYAPETDESRLKGAGAGLTDND